MSILDGVRLGIGLVVGVALVLLFALSVVIVTSRWWNKGPSRSRGTYDVFR